MGENILFKPNPAEQKPSQNMSSKEISFHETPPPSSKLPISLILKLALGSLVLIFIGFLVFGFLIPKIFTNLKQEEVEILYWGVEKDLKLMDPIIAEFESKYTNIKINYAKQDLNQYRERLIARADIGTGPDIFQFHNTWLSMLKSIIQPIPENVLPKEDFTQNYYPVIKKDIVDRGAIYGVPLGIDTLSLYINKSIFDASGLDEPKTWIDFANFSRALTVKDETGKIKTAGAAMGLSSNVNYASDIVSMLMSQNGVDLRNISGNLEATADAMNFYVSFAQFGSNVWDETLDNSIRAFASGQLAMYFGYARDFTLIKSMNPNLTFEIHPVPTLPDRFKTVASYWVEGISSKTKHQKEAFIFLKFLTEKENILKLNSPPARIDLAENFKNNPNLNPFLEGAKNAVSSYFVEGTFDNGLNTKMNTSLYSALDSILNGTPPESASQTFSEAFSQVLKEYSTSH